MGPQQNNQMHPEDTKNLIVFVILSVGLFFIYDYLILKPRAAEQQAYQQQIEAAAPQTSAPKGSKDRQTAITEDLRVTIDNGEIFGSISLTGGRIDDIGLRAYYETKERKDPVVLLSPAETEHPRYIDYGWIAADETDAQNLPGPKTPWNVQGNTRLRQDNPVTLYWDNGQGLRFERQFSIDEHYVITITQRVTNNGAQGVALYPYGLIAQKGLMPYFEGRWISHEGPIGWVGEKLEEISYKDLRKDPKKSFQGTGGWTGITDKYWLTGLIPPQSQQVTYSYQYSGDEAGEKNSGRFQADFVGAAVNVGPGQSVTVESHAFIGAKKVLALQNYSERLKMPHFDLAVDFGWFWFFTKPFFYALHYLGAFTGNMGLAIIFLTIAIRSAVFPLTNMSYRSFAKMKKVSPQMMELRKKHGDDKQKLQQEIMALYQREGVNPMAGCLPMILQIPIFFALYKILFITIEIRHAPFFGWIQDLSAPDPTSIFNLFGLIPWDPPGFLMIGVWPCIMLLAMLVQRKLNPPPQDPIQRDMALYFPFIMTFILAQFASGLVIYWTLSAVIGVIQQMIIMRSLNVPIHLFGETEEEKELEKAVEKGPAVHPLVEMAEEEVEDALFGHEDEQAPPKKISPPKPKKSRPKKKKKK